MGFEYGSQAIEIRNPFRLEGLAYSVRGVVTVGLGLVLILGEQGVLPFVGGLALISAGLYALGLGLFKLFRFFVGRGVPANLVREVSSAPSIAPGSEDTFRYEGAFYSPGMLSEMLVGRKNLTFVEPQGWLSRLLHSLFYPLIFLPYPMRSITLKLFQAAWYAVLLVVLFGLALLFARATGLVQVTTTPVAAYLGAASMVVALLVWLRFQPWRGGRYRINSRSWLIPILVIAVPLLITAGLVGVQEHAGLPQLPVSPHPWFGAVILGILLAFAYAMLLAYRRAPRRGTVPTEVSEYRDHWQESVHPMDIFRVLEMTLINHRYKEIPNRVYIQQEPDLQGQGSENKGEFKGETLQEIQPIPVDGGRRDPLILPGVLLGQLLLLGAAVWLFTVFQSLETITPETLVPAVLGPVLLWLLGRSLAFVAHIYLAEIHFESQLIAFRASGTYSESRLATGMSIYDSTRSENTFVRSSLTPWLVVSDIHSSIIAVSGAMNLEQPRYVLRMERNDALSNELVDDMRGYLRDRQVMAGVQSASDLQAASTIHQMNEQTRAQVSSPSLPHPPVSEEIRQERLGHSDDKDK